MPQPPRIAVVGSSNVDLTFRTPRLPLPGETLAGHSLHIGCGGKGGNQAVAAARLGASVVLISRVGADAFADQLVRSYEQQGVDVRHVARDPQLPTGAAVILVDDAAQNCIVVAAGANAAVTPELVQDAREDLIKVNVLLGQLEVPVSAVSAAFQIAHDAGVQTILNPAPAAPLPAELLRNTDICVPNETELHTLTGRSTQGLPEVEAAARALLAQGPGTVVVTLGARGTLVVTAQAAEHIPPHPVRPVDPTGAGDAFIGSLAVFLAEGLSLREAAHRASVAAALTVTRLGTQAAFPGRAEVSRHFPS